MRILLAETVQKFDVVFIKVQVDFMVSNILIFRLNIGDKTNYTYLEAFKFFNS